MQVDGLVLVAARALVGLSQDEFAAEAGIHKNALQRIEAGGDMRLSTLQKLLAAYTRLGVELLAGPDGSLNGVRRGSAAPSVVSSRPPRARLSKDGGAAG